MFHFSWLHRLKYRWNYKNLSKNLILYDAQFRDHLSPMPSPDQITDAVNRIEAQIKALDEEIQRFNGILCMIQPVGPGRITVRMIATQRLKPRRPVFVMWYWTRQSRSEGKMRRYKTISNAEAMKRVKQYGPFAIAHQDIREVMRWILVLMARRNALENIMAKLVMRTARITDAVRKLDPAGIPSDLNVVPPKT
jgi:hypothetical protein